MIGLPPLTLADALRLSRLTDRDLWARYLALGGNHDLVRLRGHLIDHGCPDNCPDDIDHNVIAHALNEAFAEQGHDYPLTYLHLYQHPDEQMD